MYAVIKEVAITEWQPIDSAPRDGSTVQIGAFVEGLLVMQLPAYWDGSKWVSTLDDSHWSEGDGCGPTHWRETQP